MNRKVKNTLLSTITIQLPIFLKVFITVVTLFSPVLSSAIELSELKHEVIKKLEKAQQQYGERNCCATEEDKAIALSQFDQGSIDFISISTYQKLAHECEILSNEPKTTNLPAFKLEQVDFTLAYKCGIKLTGQFNDAQLQLMISTQDGDDLLKIIGLCVLPKEGNTRCDYNYFRTKYPDYTQAMCPFYKSDVAYALYQRYQDYKKAHAYPEFSEISNKARNQIIRDAFKPYTDGDKLKPQPGDLLQSAYEKADNNAHLAVMKMRMTDPKYQQELIANQAIVLARQYQQKYFVEIDLINDIAADLKQIRRQLVDSGEVMVPYSGVQREDVRLIGVGTLGADRLRILPDKVNAFEKEFPADIECMNQFWGFNHVTIRAIQNNWNPEGEPWEFYMTLGGEHFFESIHTLEYIKLAYFEKYSLAPWDAVASTRACHVTRDPKLSLIKAKNDGQIYVYSSGDSDCPAGCIDKYHTFFRSSPSQSQVVHEPSYLMPKCSYEADDYQDFFSYR